MNIALTVIQSGTFRRLLAVILGASVVAFGRRFGVELNAEELAALTVMVLTYLIQSAARQGKDGAPAAPAPPPPPVPPVLVAKGPQP